MARYAATMHARRGRVNDDTSDSFTARSSTPVSLVTCPLMENSNEHKRAFYEDKYA